MNKSYSFTYERDTKNTLVFREDAVEGTEDIGTLYLQKRSDLGRQRPTTLKLTLEAEVLS